jgi:hypothetical protein
VILLLILSHIQQCLHLLSFPYDSKGVNIITLFNEIAVSTYLYLTMLISDYSETMFNNLAEIQIFRLKIAWMIAGLLILVIAVNFIFAIFNILTSWCLMIKRYRMKNKGKDDGRTNTPVIVIKI